MDKDKFIKAKNIADKIERLKNRSAIQAQEKMNDIISIDEITIRCKMKDGYMADFHCPVKCLPSFLMPFLEKNEELIHNEIINLQKEFDSL